MSYTIDYGYTQPVATKNLAISDWSYSDFTAPITKGSDKHTVIKFTNKTSPLDRPMIVEITRDFRDNIYKGTGINPEYKSPVTDGLVLKVRITTIKKITDSNGEYVYIPVAFTQTLSWGLHPAIDASIILADLKDYFGLWFPTASVTANQIADFIAGGPGMLDETSD